VSGAAQPAHEAAHPLKPDLLSPAISLFVNCETQLEKIDIHGLKQAYDQG